MRQTAAAGFVWPSQKDSDYISDSLVIEVLPEPALGRRDVLMFDKEIIAKYFS